MEEHDHLPEKLAVSTRPFVINPSTCPEYFRWIHEDLKHWKDKGISKDLVEEGKRLANFRLIILDGKIYTEEFERCFQTRMLFTVWGIVQLSRWYPRRLPDLELMFQCGDHPVVRANDFPSGIGPPVFRYSSNQESLDIVFPEWSFWGWAEVNIKPWKLIIKEMKEGNERRKWEDRVPYAYWKGNPEVSESRGELMKCNVTPQYDWNAHLYVQDWDKETKNGFKHSNLADQCTHRYKIYIEGRGWSVSQKYILGCNSPTLVVTPNYYDFFSRGLMPQRHYWPVRGDDKCRSIKFGVEWGNNHTQKAKAMGEAGSGFVREELKMKFVYDYMLHVLNQYAKLLNYKPTVPPNAVEVCAESLACVAEGTQRKFMEESLEKFPSNSVPCELPPPLGLHDFVDGKMRAVSEVAGWEKEYWASFDSNLKNNSI